jgi:hypothetical protein
MAILRMLFVVLQVLHLSTQQQLVQPCAGLHPVQPIHGPGPQQYYSGCRSVQQLSEVQPVLDFIRAHADKLASDKSAQTVLSGAVEVESSVRAVAFSH